MLVLNFRRRILFSAFFQVESKDAVALYQSSALAIFNHPLRGLNIKSVEITVRSSDDGSCAQ